MALKVVVTFSRQLGEPIMSPLKKAGLEVVQKHCTTEEQVIEAGKEADALMITSLPLTSRKVLQALPKLKVVARAGVGYDSVDVRAATELGIMVCNTPGVNTTEVADHAMALLLSITRRIPELNAEVKGGAWSDRFGDLDKIRGRLLRIAGNVVGINGFGNIGRAFATRVRGFGPSRILVHDPYVFQTTGDLYGAQMVDFDTLLKESDFITTHTPYSSETYHMFNDAAFAKMKPTAIFINTSRGPVVDEAALASALRSKKIAGAGIDVTEVEPLDAESPLLKTENLLITPHFAGASAVSTAAGAQRWAENVALVLTGKQPHGLANPDVIKKIAVLRSQNSPRWAGVPA
ncbi:MAG: C-terminal binding protein [SAR202 cluster bacterium]|nr:C-terminal binding protein [SAR202 cluster bacterium]